MKEYSRQGQQASVKTICFKVLKIVIIRSYML